MDKPITNSYYVIPDKVYAGEYPGDLHNPEEKVQRLVEFGITHFIDLTQDGELNPYAQFLPESCIHYRFPIPDVSVHEYCKDVYDLLNYVDSVIKTADNKVYIHCWGGVGRTGTIVGCLYEYLGESYMQAIEHLRESFRMCPKSERRIAPETREQLEFIKDFESYLKIHNLKK